MMVAIRRKNKPLCNALIADSLFSRMHGLMFRASAIPILFKFRNSAIWPIHSLFVFFPFDAVYLDPGKRIVEIIPNIPSWQFLISPKFPSQFLLELPSGASEGIKIGDTLEW